MTSLAAYLSLSRLLKCKTLKRHFVWHRHTSARAHREQPTSFIGGNWIQYHFIISVVHIETFSHCIQIVFLQRAMIHMRCLEPPLRPFPAHLCSHFEMLLLSSAENIFGEAKVSISNRTKEGFPFHCRLISSIVRRHKSSESLEQFLNLSYDTRGSELNQSLSCLN